MALLDFDFLNGASQLNGSGLNTNRFTQPTFDDSLNSMTTQTTAPVGAGLLDFNLSDQYKMPLTDKMQGGIGKGLDWMAQNQSLLNFGVGALQGLGSLYSANQTSKLLKDQLGLQRETMDRNYNMNRTQYNEALADRQRQRVAANPNAESVASVMSKWSL